MTPSGRICSTEQRRREIDAVNAASEAARRQVAARSAELAAFKQRQQAEFDALPRLTAGELAKRVRSANPYSDGHDWVKYFGKRVYGYGYTGDGLEGHYAFLVPRHGGLILEIDDSGFSYKVTHVFRGSDIVPRAWVDAGSSSVRSWGNEYIPRPDP